MKKLILVFIFLTPAYLALQAQDLQAEVRQSTFDKILGSIHFPFTVVEFSDPFRKSGDPDQNIFLDEDLFTKSYSTPESHNLYKWAFDANVSKSEVEDVFRAALQNEWEKVINELKSYTDLYDSVAANKIGGIKTKDLSYDELSIEDMKAIQNASLENGLKLLAAEEKGGFDLKGHLAYLRVDLRSRPTLKVASPNFDANSIRVETTVTGELWSKLPEFHCCRTFLGICVCVRVDWVWKRIASLTVSPDIGADATITFSEKNLKVIAQGKFRKLFLDYQIIRDLNLAGVANHFLAGKTFELYDASAFVASIPYINSQFRIESITIPANPNGVSIQINVKQ